MFPHKHAKFPWNNWYHVMCHTYGTWLPGDPKGFRTRHHREHVEGDYKNPPPRGKYDQLWKRSKELMKRDPVYLTVPQRQRAVEEFAKSFAKWRVLVAILSIDRIHFHGIIQVLTYNPRHFVGLAKKECSAYMKLDGLTAPGGLWAVRCKCLPIADDSHLTSARDYIHDHIDLGAAIYQPADTIDIPIDALLVE